MSGKQKNAKTKHGKNKLAEIGVHACDTTVRNQLNEMGFHTEKPKENQH